MGRNINKKTGHGYSWKGNNITYRRLHTWLRETYGSATRCENPLCDRTSSKFQYAKIKEKEYERNIENFIQLCVKCHSRYDNHGEKVKLALMGRPHSKERIIRIRRGIIKSFKNGRIPWNKNKNDNKQFTRTQKITISPTIRTETTHKIQRL